MDPQQGTLQGSHGCVCLKFYPMQSGTVSLRIRAHSFHSHQHSHGVEIKAVQAGTEDIPDRGRLSLGNRQEKPQDITQGANGNGKIQLRTSQALLSHREGTVCSDPPGLAGSWQHHS